MSQSISRTHGASRRRSAGRLLIVFGPILAAGALTVLVALVAGLSGFYPHDMYAIAAVLGILVTSLVTVLFFRQTAGRRDSEHALANSQARVRDILDAAMDPIICADNSQRIILFNAAAERAFGWPRDAVLGRPLDKLIPERYRAIHHAHVETFGRTGTTARRMGADIVLRGLRANGEEFPIEASISQHREDDKQIFTVILRDVTERIRVESELQEFAKASQSAREEEKSRIARELHDELAQSLTALKIDLAWTAERLPKGEPVLAEKLARMQAMVDATVIATGRISADLRPAMLDELGLPAAVEWLVDSFRERHGIECELEISDEELDLREPYASCVFRMLQESLTNAARHSHASLVRVALKRKGGEVVLSVSDNGRGFQAEGPRKQGSYGLMGLRERAYLIGGSVRIESAPDQGTAIEARIPLAPGQGKP